LNLYFSRLCNRSPGNIIAFEKRPFLVYHHSFVFRWCVIGREEIHCIGDLVLVEESEGQGAGEQQRDDYEWNRMPCHETSILVEKNPDPGFEKVKTKHNAESS